MIPSDPMQYRMVFCDIDGTLINSEHHISQRTKQEIQELYHGGIPFILVSARMPSGIYPLQLELGIKAPIVCYSGALILNERGSPIKTIGIDREKAIRIDTFLKKEWSSICCSAYSCNDWLTDNIRNKWIMKEQRITTSVPIEGRISDFSEKTQIHKLLCMGEAEMISELSIGLKEMFSGLSIYRSKDTYLEIMNGTVSKSDAVKYLCKDYNIPIEATVSFGDNYNDVDMLMATGTSFAMGNAPEEVKRLAMHVTLDNDREGVALGLQQLNFMKNRI
ncbi:HAD family phosphatase [Anoxybacterium hadale]|uniref:HAD family phosphatase n=2 Tax=Anoxybacterium hadale TaxID=3408580 RepID=A0ACD1AHI9_9FIRM|nr:HAD family phosphatase [Clostridiales bacterium]